MHGTDTLAYTASMLSFILVRLHKPVVLTGAQLPLSAVYSDGYANLAGAVLCATLPIHEVTIYFGHKLMRGNRTQKVSAWALDAFDSLTLEPLLRQGCTARVAKYIVESYRPVWPEGAEWGGGVRDEELENQSSFDERMYCVCGQPAATSTPLYVVRPSEDIHMVILYPGIGARNIDALRGARGLVVQAYGSGNGPDDPALLGALERLRGEGCAIVVVTQTHMGIVNLGAYAAGHGLAKAGARGGHCMTPEAAFCKLAYLVGLGLGRDAVEREFDRCLRGEFQVEGEEFRELR